MRSSQKSFFIIVLTFDGEIINSSFDMRLYLDGVLVLIKNTDASVKTCMYTEGIFQDYPSNCITTIYYTAQDALRVLIGC